MFHLRLLITALVSLKQNLLRSLLATLGVIIGVGAVVAAVSILEGAQRDILDRFESLGADQIMIFNGQEQRSHRSTTVNSLLPEDADLLSRENEGLIVSTSPQFTGSGQVKYFEKNVNAFVLGATHAYAPMNSYLVENGRFITDEDVRGNAMVCVLGYKVAEDLFGVLPTVGKTVKIEGRTFNIVGVMEEKGTLGMIEVDNQVIIPLSTAMSRMFGQKYLTMLVAQCADAKRVPTCIERVKKTLRTSHRIKAGDEDDFRIFTQERIKQEFGQVAVIFAVVLYSIAGISVLVGAIGIMNIMLVSVTERTREIGLRMAVGARTRDILGQFLVEAVTLSLLGGLVGIAIGIGTAVGIAEIAGWRIVLSPESVMLAVAFAFAIGVFFGFYPARKAALLNPVEALRFE